MAKKNIDRQALMQAVRESHELSDEQKADILQLISEQKKYGLVWEDSVEEIEEILRTKIPVLAEDKSKAIISPLQGESEGSAPNHILIEGDNLPALDALTYTHEGKIDVIYIDPPYNTGNKDFVYNDSFVDSEDGYRHSKWLSFMEKRLRIAKKLLSDKGVIFISIDDNEQANLKLLCDEVLNGMDFIATIPWRKRTAKSDVPHSFSQDYEWLVCYSFGNYRAGIKKETRRYYETPDLPGRPWRVHDLTKQTSAEERPMSYFTIVNPKTGEEYPASKNRTWCITSDTLPFYESQKRIVYPGDYDFLNIQRPVLRYWKEDDEKKAGDFFGFTSVSSFLPIEVGMTQDGTKDLDAIFGRKAFGFPKPLALIKYILQISTPLAKDITILDFFAGSGTTLHATMQLNADDGGHRQCILVTNNENNICEEVTYERNKRVIMGYTTPKGVEVEGLHNNNLRYYKIEFVDRGNTHQALRDEAYAMTDILCIKEGVYTEQKMFGMLSLAGKEKMIRYFAEGETKMLLIYDSRVIPYVVKEISKMDDVNIKVYVFADGSYPYTADFEDVMGNVTLVAMPYSMNRAMRNVLPAKTDAELEGEPETDEEDAQ